MKRMLVILIAICVLLFAAPGFASFTRLTGGDSEPIPSASLETQAPPSNATSAEARQQIQDILGRSDYSRWSPERLETEQSAIDDLPAMEKLAELWKAFWKALKKMWEYFWEPISNFFGDLWDWLKGLFPSPSPTSPLGPSNPSSGWNIDFPFILRLIGWVLLAAVIVVLGFLIFKRMRGMPKSGRSARVLSRQQVRTALESGEALALEGHEWVEQADKLLAEKDLRAVYRALYLAMLAGLHSSGKIDFRQTRTNWFYVRRFKGGDGDRGVFSELTELFDEVWYGNRTARIDEVSRVKSKVVSLVGEAALVPAQATQAQKGASRA